MNKTLLACGLALVGAATLIAGGHADSAGSGTAPAPMDAPAASAAPIQPPAEPAQAPAGPADAPAAAASPAAATSDSEFANRAAIVGMTEVKLGELAATNAADADVKAYGKRMVDDHGKANQELTTLAAQKNITLPSAIDDKHQKMVDELTALKGAEFDKAYMGHMVHGHQGAITDFQTASTSASDPDIKAFAAKTLPTLQDHLTNAQTVAQKVGAPLKAADATER